LIIDTASAGIEDIPTNDTGGGGVYPEPPLEITILPIIPSPIVASAVAPDPPPPINEMLGADSYPYPGLVNSTQILLLVHLYNQILY